MKELVVVGKSEFTLGFRLTGIKKVIGTDNLEEDIEKLLKDQSNGIVILDENTMKLLDSRIREKVVSSINPVFVLVSQEAKQDELRKMIIQSIGVDLLKDEEN